MTDLLDLELSNRSYNCLWRAGITTIEELQSKSEARLMRVRNMGEKTLKEIREKLAKWQKENQPVKIVEEQSSDILNFTVELNKIKIIEQVELALINSFDLNPYNYVVRNIISDKVDELVKANKDEIIERIVNKAAENIQKKALPKLIEKMGA